MRFNFTSLVYIGNAGSSIQFAIIMDICNCDITVLFNYLFMNYDTMVLGSYQDTLTSEAKRKH